jgi:elongation factor Ts
MTITADMVKQLREDTGAAVLDCKKALEQYEGDFAKAKAYLAEKGLATAKKKEGRAAREGIVEVYQHPGGRVGVMLELNCETDFVAKTPKFLDLAHDLALHIAFSNPQFVDLSDVPADVLEAQKQAYYQEAKASGKPDNVIEKIVEGRLSKHFAEVCLMKQPFVKDDEITIGDMITAAIGDLKENIRVSRFARFELGGTGADHEGGGEE